MPGIAAVDCTNLDFIFAKCLTVPQTHALTTHPCSHTSHLLQCEPVLAYPHLERHLHDESCSEHRETSLSVQLHEALSNNRQSNNAHVLAFDTSKTLKRNMEVETLNAMVHWKHEIMCVRSVLSSHDEMITAVMNIEPLPNDVLSLILEQLQKTVQPEFITAMRKFLDGLSEYENFTPCCISEETASARQNAIFELVLCMCSYSKASAWHLHNIPKLLHSLTSKMEELVELSKMKSIVTKRQRKRNKHLHMIHKNWNMAVAYA